MLDTLCSLTSIDIIHSEPVVKGRHDSVVITLSCGEKRFVKQAPIQQIQTEQYALSQLKKVTSLSACSFLFPNVFELPDQKSEVGLLMTSFIDVEARNAKVKANVDIANKSNCDKEQLLSKQSHFISALAQLHSFDISNFQQLSQWQFVAPTLPDMVELGTILTGEQQLKANQVVEQYKQALNSLESGQIEPYVAVNHGDLTPDNLLLVGDKLALFDWEYATITDVRWDLATLAVEFQLSNAEYISLCRTYLGFYFTSTSLSNSESVDNFLKGAFIWRDIYRFTCLQWAISSQQPIENYLNQT